MNKIKNTYEKPDTSTGIDFIRSIIKNDLEDNKEIVITTRFPPEPNGYIHIGHAKSIFLNFSIANENNGIFNLRFDDTNPAKEEVKYVEAIKADLKWLGVDWKDNIYYSSDYFDKLHTYAIELIKKGKAYVCSLNADQTREFRGTLKEPGTNSPYRNRTEEENLELFTKMCNGEFGDGEHVLRAKIDMASPNLNMRDPVIYRIKKVAHHRTGDNWSVYPMYDFTHCLSDSIENITHSICTLEFENNKPLYLWFLNELNIHPQPKQIEFARLNLTHTVLSKRMLSELVEKGYVSGWDDPRMPTISGLRKRGYTPSAIRKFCELIGVAKRDSTVDMALLEHCIRNDLNKTATRAMAVLKPLLVVIENYPKDISNDELDYINNPEDPDMGTRKVPFSRELFIEEDDFCEDPPKKFFRLTIGREVRLRYAFYIKCTGVEKDEKTGKVTKIICTYDPKTRGGSSPDKRKVKSTIHWVSANHSIKADVRLFNTLFTKENPIKDKSGRKFTDFINSDSVEVLESCRIEPGLKNADVNTRYQFERKGYFTLDPDSLSSDVPVFNRIVSLRDTWAKISKRQKKG